MNALSFFESVISERNKAGQGVRRELMDAEIPAEIRALLPRK